MRIEAKGLAYHMFSRLIREAETPSFTVRGGEPFKFCGKSGKLDVIFEGRSGDRKVATLTSMSGEVEISPESFIGSQVKDHLQVVAAAVAAAAKRAHEAYLERHTRLEQDGMDIIGPRDQNKKIAVLRTSRQEGLRLAAFGAYLNDALPGRLTPLSLNETQSGYFSVTISMCGEKETNAPLLILRSSGNRLETECFVQGEKARLEFMEHVFDVMRSRKNRVTQDPDLSERMRDMVTSVEQNWFDRDSQHNRKAGIFDFLNHSNDKALLLRTHPFQRPYRSENVEVDLGCHLTSVVSVGNGRGSIEGFTFKGEPISGEGGFLRGIENTRAFWSKASALTLLLRPDLMPREASIYMGKPAVPEDEDFNRSVLEAIETLRRVDDPDAPVM